MGTSSDQIFINEGFVEFTKGKTKLAIVSEGTSSLIACQKYISFGCIAEVSSWISERPVGNGSFPNVGSTKRSWTWCEWSRQKWRLTRSTQVARLYKQRERNEQIEHFRYTVHCVAETKKTSDKQHGTSIKNDSLQHIAHSSGEVAQGMKISVS